VERDSGGVHTVLLQKAGLCSGPKRDSSPKGGVIALRVIALRVIALRVIEIGEQ
jgi:hypothetical protein